MQSSKLELVELQYWLIWDFLLGKGATPPPLEPHRQGSFLKGQFQLKTIPGKLLGMFLENQPTTVSCFVSQSGLSIFPIFPAAQNWHAPLQKWFDIEGALRNRKETFQLSAVIVPRCIYSLFLAICAQKLEGAFPDEGKKRHIGIAAQPNTPHLNTSVTAVYKPNGDLTIFDKSCLYRR